MKEASFYRDTWAEIDLDAVYENVRNAKQHVSEHKEIIAVVKANAYGHGAAPVARTALEAGATRVAVAFLDEALSLRQAGITAPILVLGASRPEDVNVAAAHNIALTVFQPQWLEQAAAIWKSEQLLRIHLKFDSGMGRLGIRTNEETATCATLLKRMRSIEVEGAFTHFATADELNTAYIERQYERFLQQLAWLHEQGIEPRLVHSSNSAASLRFPDTVCNAARIGIAMYGLTPSPEITSLLPYELHEVFSLHSKLVQVKKVEPGEGISYGATYKTAGEEWIGTVPIGYADGWIRKLQGFEVLVDGERVPIVGRICMDQFMVKLPRQFVVGTTVTLIGRQKQQAVSVNDVAAYLGTINYEIPCLINFRVPRVFRRHGQVVEIENLLAQR